MPGQPSPLPGIDMKAVYLLRERGKKIDLVLLQVFWSEARAFGGPRRAPRRFKRATLPFG